MLMLKLPPMCKRLGERAPLLPGLPLQLDITAPPFHAAVTSARAAGPPREAEASANMFVALKPWGLGRICTFAGPGSWGILCAGPSACAPPPRIFDC